MSSTCPPGHILSRDPQDLSKTRCVPIPSKPYITLNYPFQPNHSVYCSQGNANLEGSHSHDNILYSIDFLTPPEQKAGEIYAAHEGIAFVYNECSFRKTDYNYHNLDGCGDGFGNHVRILHPNGYLTIYAHLSFVTIKHKTYVKTGEKIGVEGISGNAGKRHLHFGLHIPEDQSLIESVPGYVGKSIPFQMMLKINGSKKLYLSTDIPSDETLNGPLLEGIP